VSRRILCVASVALLTALYCLMPAAHSQSVEGQINGTVTDTSGSVVPGAEIDLKNVDTGAERKTVSAGSGVYFLSSVPPGRYTLSVSASGFQAYQVSQITLLVNQALTVDAHLSPGAVTQTVEVSGGGVTINTTEATIGTVVGQRDVVAMPLNGRNFTELIQLTPGVAPIQTGQQNSFIITGGISPAVNGMRAQMNNFTLDGVDNNQRFSNTYATSPPPDAIAEFKVASHETGADVSLAAGANVNLVTRSGSNEFHGTLWEFLRNNDLDARNYFDNFFNSPTLPYRQNQFGYYVGGPIFLPHMIDGRKTQTYFSTYYEGLRFNQSNTYTATVPTAAERSGNFSDLLGPSTGTDCLGRTVLQGEIYDPTTTVANPSCPGGFVRNPFPNNTIPAVNPVAAAYLQYYYPAANRATTPNLVTAQTLVEAANQWGIRIDQVLSNGQQIYGRASFYNWVNTSPGGLPANPTQQQNHGANIGIHYTKVFSPTFLMDLLAGYNRSGIPLYNPGIGGSNGAAFDEAVGPNFYNKFTVGGSVPVSQGLGGSTYTSPSFISYELANPDYSYQYNGDFKKVSGSHEISFGFRYMRFRHIASAQGAAGQGYSPQTTDFPGISTTGNSLTSFMLGYPTSTNQNILPYFNDWGNIYNGYFGDTWKVSPKLTLNLGLQYVYASPPLVKQNKISLFDWTIALTQPDATDFTYAYLWCATNPITGAPPNCPRPSIMAPDRKNFAPRLGVAYSLSRQTVLRMGFGIFYDFNSNIEQNSIRVSQGVYPFGTSLSLSGENLTTLGSLSLSNPYPGTPGAAPIPNQSIDPSNRSPYAMEWNVGFEQMMPWAMKLSTDYVGSGGRRLIITFPQNIAVLGAGSIDSRRPLHNGSVFPYRETVGGSSYNALQVKLERQFKSGLTFLNSYTYSKSLDLESDANNDIGPPAYTYNPRLSYGPSDFDLTQVNTTSLVYELPVGRGRRYAADAPRIVDLFIGGWQTSGIVALRSGEWSSVTLGYDQANVGDTTGEQTANRVGNLFTAGTRTRAAWFNTAAYQVPAFGRLGGSGRNSLRGPEYKDVDLAVMKNFELLERLHLQFRSEFFNFFNHTNFENPTTVFSSSDFGQILAANPSREIQGSLKLIW
jgi:Carboxypeptidase regulatory-like domain